MTCINAYGLVSVLYVQIDRCLWMGLSDGWIDKDVMNVRIANGLKSVEDWSESVMEVRSR